MTKKYLLQLFVDFLQKTMYNLFYDTCRKTPKVAHKEQIINEPSGQDVREGFRPPGQDHAGIHFPPRIGQGDQSEPLEADNALPDLQDPAERALCRAPFAEIPLTLLLHPRRPPVGHMAGFAVLAGRVHCLQCKHLSRVTTEAIVVCGLDPGMRLVALVAIQASHGHMVRERGIRRLPVTAQATLPVRNECFLLLG